MSFSRSISSSSVLNNSAPKPSPFIAASSFSVLILSDLGGATDSSSESRVASVALRLRPFLEVVPLTEAEAEVFFAGLAALLGVVEALLVLGLPKPRLMALNCWLWEE